MKHSEMTNEELAKELVEPIPDGSRLHRSDVLREAAARLRRPTPVDDDLLKMARDIDRLRAKLKVAEDALQKIFNKVFVDCEVAEIANNALAAIRGKGATNG